MMCEEASAPAEALVREVAPDDFTAIGVVAFTTRREAGSFGTASDEPVRSALGRWSALQRLLAPFGRRLATAHQVHGDRVLLHEGTWEGWLRSEGADGHASLARGTGMAVSVADCVPVFVAHPAGAIALLHSGWRGTEAGILLHAIALLGAHGLRPGDLLVHLGPAICGRCYEVSPDVYGRLTGRTVSAPTAVDLRAIIADQAHGAGVRRVTASSSCTRCDNAQFFSHRAGDAGRQVGVMIASP